MMIFTLTHKYRIYPSKSQISNLENQFSMCRHLYNWNLKERIEIFEKDGKTVTYYDQAKNLKELKIERPWFKGVYSQVLQDVLKRLDKSYQNFFRRVKAGETPGFPKFKSKGQWHSITYPQFRKLPEQNAITVPKVGPVKIKYHRPIPENAQIKTLTISKEADKWFACFSFEQEFDPELKPVDRTIGIDLGLKDFWYGSDGQHLVVPKFLRKLEQKLKKFQTKLSKAVKGSPRYYKLLKIVRKIHYRIKCQRMDFLHKTANKLLSEFDVIVHEDLKIKNMIRRPKPKLEKETGKYLPNGASAKGGLNKSISDAGWGMFLNILNYKSQLLGKQTIPVDPRNTSQKCSGCARIVKKSLAQRTHDCPFCGLQIHRDQNATINILTLGLKSLAASAA